MFRKIFASFHHLSKQSLSLPSNTQNSLIFVIRSGILHLWCRNALGATGRWQLLCSLSLLDT
jgi:hypothetical protein